MGHNYSFSYSPSAQVPQYPPHPAQTMQMSPQSSMQAPLYPGMQRMMPGPGGPMAPYVGANTGADGMMMHQQVGTDN